MTIEKVAVIVKFQSYDRYWKSGPMSRYELSHIRLFPEPICMLKLLIEIMSELSHIDALDPEWR